MSKTKKTVQLPRPKTDNQQVLLEMMQHLEMVITIGPAGTGKSYLPAAYAAYLFSKKAIDKIILTRPVVPTGKSIGFFPGDLNEKMMPWTAPFVRVLEDSLGKDTVATMINEGGLEVVPFEVIRGRTFDHAFVILDEAQNTTEVEIKAFVTRIGEGSITVINGDLAQSDLKDPEYSGLNKICQLIDTTPALKNKVGFVEFTVEDIVRSELCKLWVKAFH